MLQFVQGSSRDMQLSAFCDASVTDKMAIELP